MVTVVPDAEAEVSAWDDAAVSYDEDDKLDWAIAPAPSTDIKFENEPVASVFSTPACPTAA